MTLDGLFTRNFASKIFKLLLVMLICGNGGMPIINKGYIERTAEKQKVSTPLCGDFSR